MQDYEITPFVESLKLSNLSNSNRFVESLSLTVQTNDYNTYSRAPKVNIQLALGTKEVPQETTK